MRVTADALARLREEQEREYQERDRARIWRICREGGCPACVRR